MNVLLLFLFLHPIECSEDDQRAHGQEVRQLLARGDWRKLWFRGHAWIEEPALHVFWREPGRVRVEVLVAAPPFALSQWWLNWKLTPASSQILVTFGFGTSACLYYHPRGSVWWSEYREHLKVWHLWLAWTAASLFRYNSCYTCFFLFFYPHKPVLYSL